jgi:hypothetical protein
MKTAQRGDAIRLLRAPAARPRREGAHVLARAVCVAALLTGAALGLAPGHAPATAAAPAASALPLSVAAAPAIDPRFAASATQVRFVRSGEPASTGSLEPGRFEPAARDGGWREEEFAQVQALDGRTLATSSLRIRLTGIELPGGDEVCRTLDGRLEPCLIRAATQLELMVRARKVSCRYRIEAAGEAAGSCRIGAADVAERIVRTGFGKRAPEARRLAMATAGSAAN